MITVSMKDFKEAVKIAKGAIASTSTTKPVLRCLRIGSEGNGLVMECTDLEQFLTQTVPATSGSLRTMLVPWEGVNTALRGKKAKVIGIRREGDDLVLDFEGLRVTVEGFTSMQPDEFPWCPAEGKTVKVVDVEADSLSDSLRRTMYAMDKSGEARYALHGINFDADEEGVRLAGSDTHRLAVATVSEKKAPETSGIMLASFCKTLAALCKDGRVAIEAIQDKAAKGTDGFIATGDGWRLQARTLDGQFPRYMGLIPKELGHGLLVKRKALVDVLDAVKTSVNKTTKAVTLRRGEKGLEIETEKATAGLEEADTSAMTTFRCNVNYLLDLLVTLDAEWVLLETENKPLSCHGPALVVEANTTHLLMPIARQHMEKDDKDTCPYCGKEYVPDLQQDDETAWGRWTCSKECALALEAAREAKAQLKAPASPVQETPRKAKANRPKVKESAGTRKAAKCPRGLANRLLRDIEEAAGGIYAGAWLDGLAPMEFDILVRALRMLTDKAEAHVGDEATEHAGEILRQFSKTLSDCERLAG